MKINVVEMCIMLFIAVVINIVELCILLCIVVPQHSTSLTKNKTNFAIKEYTWVAISDSFTEMCKRLKNLHESKIEINQFNRNRVKNSIYDV